MLSQGVENETTLTHQSGLNEHQDLILGMSLQSSAQCLELLKKHFDVSSKQSQIIQLETTIKIRKLLLQKFPDSYEKPVDDLQDMLDGLIETEDENRDPNHE